MVTVAGPGDTLNTGAPFLFTATVLNAASNAVAWSVVEPGGGSIGADGTYTAPAVPGVFTVKAVSQADASASGTAQVKVVAVHENHIAGYDVGVDYHAYGLDIDATGFIAIYNQPQVRKTVQVQLQGMAERGASFIQTAIWVAKGPCCSNAQVTFPMTDQEQANLRAYAQDVASIVGTAGNRLRLTIALNWLGAADFTIGSPTKTLGSSNLSAAEFTSRVQTTTDQLLAAVGDVTRADGVRLVDTIFLYSEAFIPAPGEPSGTPNIGWFLTTHYPRFVSRISPLGIRPSIYFGSECRDFAVLDNSYVDSAYPILDGHRSMFWVYRGLKFLADQGLPLPTSRVDFDCYIDSTAATYPQLLQRILDDADVTLPSLGAPRFYGLPETYYMADPALRFQYGQAFATQAVQNSRLQRVSFWTTPGGGPGMIEHNSAYPFTIEDFWP